MAERRMFAKTIIDSDAFLDMPISSRLLYYDLGMRADDDGFVNSPKKIMKMIGASTDDMNVLVTKKFIIPFESGIVVIKHWKIHNYIQNDRYNATKYLEEKSTLTVDENKSYKKMDTECIQVVSKLEAQVRLGKVSLDKVNKTLVDDVIDFYSRLQSLPKVIKWTDKRKGNINARINDYGIEEVEKVLSLSNCSDFLTGKVESNGKVFIADIDWIMNPNNFIKILEGKYTNKTKSEPNGLTYSNVGLTRDKGMFD